MIGQENSVRRITPDDIRIHGEKIAKMFQEHFLIELQQLKIKKNTRKMYWDIPYTNVKNLPSPTRLIGFFVSMLVIEFVTLFTDMELFCRKPFLGRSYGLIIYCWKPMNSSWILSRYIRLWKKRKNSWSPKGKKSLYQFYEPLERKSQSLQSMGKVRSEESGDLK